MKALCFVALACILAVCLASCASPYATTKTAGPVTAAGPVALPQPVQVAEVTPPSGPGQERCVRAPGVTESRLRAIGRISVSVAAGDPYFARILQDAVLAECIGAGFDVVPKEQLDRAVSEAWGESAPHTTEGDPQGTLHELLAAQTAQASVAKSLGVDGYLTGVAVPATVHRTTQGFGGQASQVLSGSERTVVGAVSMALVDPATGELLLSVVASYPSGEDILVVAQRIAQSLEREVMVR
jgi:hypothetical protein